MRTTNFVNFLYSKLFYNRRTEVWICSSTISIYQYIVWSSDIKSSRSSYAFIARGSKLLDNPEHLINLSTTYNIVIRSLSFINLCKVLALESIRLRPVTLRVPHLHPSIIKPWMWKAQKIGLLSFDLYDDGFLGILHHPSVCNYLKPIFNNICHWNLDKWRLSDSTRSKIYTPLSDHNSIPISIETLHKKWFPCRSINANPVPVYVPIILESKYMDYALLRDLLGNNSFGDISKEIFTYFEHPWSIKRNQFWPSQVKRTIVDTIQLEKFLCRELTKCNWIVTGMTSSVVLLSELVKKGLLPSFRLDILISSRMCNEGYHNESEPLDFCGYMQENYSSILDLNIHFNRKPLSL